MGYPDPQQNHGQHPGGQNYPPQPAGPNPPAGPYPPVQPGGPYPPQPGGYQPTREMGRDEAAGGTGGYELGYTQGAYGPYDGQQPPQGPPPVPGDPYGPGGGSGDDGGGNGNKKAIWIAVAAVVFVLVLAGVVVGIATSGGGSKDTAATPTTAPTTTRTTTGGMTMPSGIPSISVPPIFGGGSTTGPNARQWTVEVTGSGSAQLVTIGIPDTSLFGSQPLPWSKSFTSDAPLVTITVIGYTGDASCTIKRNGTVVSEQKSSAETSGGGPLICTSGR